MNMLNGNEAGAPDEAPLGEPDQFQEPEQMFPEHTEENDLGPVQKGSHKKSIKIVLGVAIIVCVLLCVVAFVLFRSKSAEAPSVQQEQSTSIIPESTESKVIEKTDKYTLYSVDSFNKDEPVYVKLNTKYKQVGTETKTSYTLDRMRFETGSWEKYLDLGETSARLLGVNYQTDGWTAYLSMGSLNPEGENTEVEEIYAVINGEKVVKVPHGTQSGAVLSGAILPDGKGLTLMQYQIIALENDLKGNAYKLVNYFQDKDPEVLLESADKQTGTFTGYTGYPWPIQWSDDGKTLYLNGTSKLFADGNNAELVSYSTDTKKLKLIKKASDFDADYTAGQLAPNGDYILLDYTDAPQLGMPTLLSEAAVFKNTMSIYDTKKNTLKEIYEDSGSTQLDSYSILGTNKMNSSWYIAVRTPKQGDQEVDYDFKELREYKTDGSFTTVTVPEDLLKNKDDFFYIDFADGDTIVYLTGSTGLEYSGVYVHYKDKDTFIKQ